MKVYSEGASYECAADRILAQIPDIDALAKESELVAAYTFLVTCSHHLASLKWGLPTQCP